MTTIERTLAAEEGARRSSSRYVLRSPSVTGHGTRAVAHPTHTTTGHKPERTMLLTSNPTREDLSGATNRHA
jgi:hypothetical protein